MRRKAVVLLTMGFLLELSFPWLAEARVVRFVVEQRRLFADRTEFGNVGAYERLDGTAYMEVDPKTRSTRSLSTWTGLRGTSGAW